GRAGVELPQLFKLSLFAARQTQREKFSCIAANEYSPIANGSSADNAAAGSELPRRFERQFQGWHVEPGPIGRAAEHRPILGRPRMIEPLGRQQRSNVFR